MYGCIREVDILPKERERCEILKRLYVGGSFQKITNHNRVGSSGDGLYISQVKINDLFNCKSKIS